MGNGCHGCPSPFEKQYGVVNDSTHSSPYARDACPAQNMIQVEYSLQHMSASTREGHNIPRTVAEHAMGDSRQIHIHILAVEFLRLRRMGRSCTIVFIL